MSLSATQVFYVMGAITEDSFLYPAWVTVPAVCADYLVYYIEDSSGNPFPSSIAELVAGTYGILVHLDDIVNVGDHEIFMTANFPWSGSLGITDI